jgi:hypothetical protein
MLGVMGLAPSSAAADEMRTMTGLCASAADIYWGPEDSHFPQRSYDIHYNPGGSSATSGKCVYSQTLGISGSGGTAVKQSYISNNDCTGVRTRIDKPGGTQVGRVDYVHISVSGGIPSSWSLSGVTWTVTYFGGVLASEDPDCVNAGAWSAAHLHQSDSGFPSTYNSAMTTGTNGYATGNSSNWLFRYIY